MNISQYSTFQMQVYYFLYVYSLYQCHVQYQANNSQIHVVSNLLAIISHFLILQDCPLTGQKLFQKFSCVLTLINLVCLSVVSVKFYEQPFKNCVRIRNVHIIHKDPNCFDTHMFSFIFK